MNRIQASLNQKNYDIQAFQRKVSSCHIFCEEKIATKLKTKNFEKDSDKIGCNRCLLEKFVEKLRTKLRTNYSFGIKKQGRREKER